MKITNNYTTYGKSPIFSGWKNPDSKCLLVTDISGTLVTTNPKEISRIPKVFKTAKAHKAYIVYATSAPIDKMHGLLNFAEEIMSITNSDIDASIVHHPDFIVSENGRFVFECKDGQEKKMDAYDEILKARNGKPPTKATGVRFLQQLLNIPPSEKVMIGDGDKDRPMLKLAFKEDGFFICPENASKKLKKFAQTFHCKRIVEVDECGPKAILKGLAKIMKNYNY